jgi:hypothetical protein
MLPDLRHEPEGLGGDDVDALVVDDCEDTDEAAGEVDQCVSAYSLLGVVINFLELVVAAYFSVSFGSSFNERNSASISSSRLVDSVLDFRVNMCSPNVGVSL